MTAVRKAIAKVRVAGSSPVVRSKESAGQGPSSEGPDASTGTAALLRARWTRAGWTASDIVSDHQRSAVGGRALAGGDTFDGVGAVGVAGFGVEAPSQQGGRDHWTALSSPKPIRAGRGSRRCGLW